MFTPSYLNLLESGALLQRVEEAYSHLEKCDLCAWECGVNRNAGKRGACLTGSLALVSSYGPHHGEEDVLRGCRGSGTIFFARCNMRCQYCQNYEISQSGSYPEVNPQGLAEIMLDLQEQGCHNINLVSPSHVSAQILAAVAIAARAGLRLPLVYNTGGYDSLALLSLLDGVIDIYMPDMKYSNSKIGLHYSKIRNYPAVNQAAVLEMHRQVGDLQLDSVGLATRGLLVRHLVLPNNLAGTQLTLEFLAQKISKDTFINIMDQYHPSYHASLFPDLNGPVARSEVETAFEMTKALGLWRFG